MSVAHYSGFATRSIEQSYNILVEQLLRLLQRRLINFYNSDMIAESTFTDPLKKLISEMAFFERTKLLPPKYSDNVKDLSSLLKIKIPSNASIHNITKRPLKDVIMPDAIEDTSLKPQVDQQSPLSSLSRIENAPSNYGEPMVSSVAPSQSRDQFFLSLRKTSRLTPLLSPKSVNSQENSRLHSNRDTHNQQQAIAEEDDDEYNEMADVKHKTEESDKTKDFQLLPIAQRILSESDSTDSKMQQQAGIKKSKRSVTTKKQRKRNELLNSIYSVGCSAEETNLIQLQAQMRKRRSTSNARSAEKPSFTQQLAPIILNTAYSDAYPTKVRGSSNSSSNITTTSSPQATSRATSEYNPLVSSGSVFTAGVGEAENSTYQTMYSVRIHQQEQLAKKNDDATVILPTLKSSNIALNEISSTSSMTTSVNTPSGSQASTASFELQKKFRSILNKEGNKGLNVLQPRQMNGNASPSSVYQSKSDHTQEMYGYSGKSQHIVSVFKRKVAVNENKKIGVSQGKDIMAEGSLYSGSVNSEDQIDANTKKEN